MKLMFNLKEIAHWPAAKLSAALLYTLLALTAVVFCAFFLIGFNHPSDEDPNFLEPRLTAVVLVFVGVVLLVTLVLAVVSVVRSLRVRDKERNVVNGIPVARIGLATSLLFVACMGLTFVLGSSKPMHINGVRYADSLWLKAADMFIYTAIILLLVAIIAVICSNVRNAKSRR